MKFSIILPTYNRAESFLSRAIESVINQTYIDWELIIIDNNSIDNTKNLIESYKNNQIKLYNISNNGNIAKSRNLGISKASGDYIAFLDSDDYWDQNKLKKSFTILTNNPIYDGLCHAEYWLYPDGYKLTKKYGPKEFFSSESLLMRGNSVSLSAMVIRKNKIEEINRFSEQTEIITAEDYDLWIRLAGIGTKIAFTDESLGYYQIHNLSESSNILRNTEAVISVIKSHLNNKSAQLNLALSNCWINAGKQFYLNHSNSEALRAYSKSITYDYKNIKAYILIIGLIMPVKLYKYLVKLKNI